MYIEHVGIMTVRNMKTQDYCEIDFKKRGWSGKGAFEFSGFCYNKYKDKKYKINGKWNQFFDITNLETGKSETIWTANPDMANFEQMYYFTFFALQLNHLPASLKPKLPPTDSRLRPDQRALEEGNLKLAAEEKIRLEEKQRRMR